MLDRFQSLLYCLLVNMALSLLLELGIDRVLGQHRRAHMLHVAHDHGRALLNQAIVEAYDATLIVCDVNVSVFCNLFLRKVASRVCPIVQDASLVPRHLRLLIETTVLLESALFATQLIPLIDHHILRLIRRRQVVLDVIEETTGRVMRRYFAIVEASSTAVSEMNNHHVRSPFQIVRGLDALHHLAQAMRWSFYGTVNADIDILRRVVRLERLMVKLIQID